MKKILGICFIVVASISLLGAMDIEVPAHEVEYVQFATAEQFGECLKAKGLPSFLIGFLQENIIIPRRYRPVVLTFEGIYEFYKDVYIALRPYYDQTKKSCVVEEAEIAAIFRACFPDIPYAADLCLICYHGGKEQQRLFCGSLQVPEQGLLVLAPDHGQATIFYEGIKAFIKMLLFLFSRPQVAVIKLDAVAKRLSTDYAVVHREPVTIRAYKQALACVLRCLLPWQPVLY